MTTKPDEPTPAQTSPKVVVAAEKMRSRPSSVDAGSSPGMASAVPSVNSGGREQSSQDSALAGSPSSSTASSAEQAGGASSALAAVASTAGPSSASPDQVGAAKADQSAAYEIAAREVQLDNGSVHRSTLVAWLAGATREEVRALVQARDGDIGELAPYAAGNGAGWKVPDALDVTKVHYAVGGERGFAENVLRGPLDKSWNLAKKTLTAQTEYGAGEELMQALIRFRSLHWKAIFELTKSRMQKDDLTNGFAAGSKTLTSDVDVNLKGKKTEAAVALFNKIFAKEAGWGYESGVVYDVNVYAMDFMFGVQAQPKATDKVKGMPTDKAADKGQEKPAVSATPEKRPTAPKQEGVRAGVEGGGFLEPKFAKNDHLEQDAWALVKVRMHLEESKWNDFAAGDPAIEKGLL